MDWPVVDWSNFGSSMQMTVSSLTQYIVACIDSENHYFSIFAGACYHAEEIYPTLSDNPQLSDLINRKVIFQ